MPPSQTDPNTPPDFTTQQVEWLRQIHRPQLPGVPPNDVTDPAARMALATAVQIGKRIVVESVENAYNHHRQKEREGDVAKHQRPRGRRK